MLIVWQFCNFVHGAYWSFCIQFISFYIVVVLIVLFLMVFYTSNDKKKMLDVNKLKDAVMYVNVTEQWKYFLPHIQACICWMLNLVLIFSGHSLFFFEMWIQVFVCCFTPHCSGFLLVLFLGSGMLGSISISTTLFVHK